MRLLTVMLSFVNSGRLVSPGSPSTILGHRLLNRWGSRSTRAQLDRMPMRPCWSIITTRVRAWTATFDSEETFVFDVRHRACSSSLSSLKCCALYDCMQTLAPFQVLLPILSLQNSIALHIVAYRCSLVHEKQRTPRKSEAKNIVRDSPLISKRNTNNVTPAARSSLSGSPDRHGPSPSCHFSAKRW